MALKVKSNFIIEDILDENDNKIGELKFNPNDARIMNRLAKCLDYAEKALNKLKNMGEIPDLSKIEINSVEDAENISSAIEKVSNALSLEEDCASMVIDELSEIFGKETIEIFTEGTKDIETINPVLDFVMPYVREARESKVNKYNVKKISDVME